MFPFSRTAQESFARRKEHTRWAKEMLKIPHLISLFYGIFMLEEEERNSKKEIEQHGPSQKSEERKATNSLWHIWDDNQAELDARMRYSLWGSWTGKWFQFPKSQWLNSRTKEILFRCWTNPNASIVQLAQPRPPLQQHKNFASAHYALDKSTSGNHWVGIHAR